MKAPAVPPPIVRPSNRSRRVVVVYGLWSFVASLLIFWVELMVAKLLLPRFGGSASVWNTSLVFFQVSLLAGYFVAHLLRRFDSRRHKAIQTVLVVAPAFTLPIALPAVVANQAVAPTVAVLVALVLMVGAPFFALATASPTLQSWFSHSDHRRAADPYFLYALSNVGSLIGLFGYPLFVERVLSLRGQALWWSGLYLVFVGLNIAGARVVGGWTRSIVRTGDRERLKLKRKVGWAAVAFVPSLALLGVTRHLSTDVAAFPLMWTVPLGIYLASFVVTFRADAGRWTDIAARALRILLVPTALLAVSITQDLWLSVTLPLVVLLAVSVAAHGRVYADRPEAAALTDFYLWVSAGGAAGGLFASLIAPAVFESVLEFPLALVLAALVAAPSLRGHRWNRWVVLGVAAAVALMGLVVEDTAVRVLVFGLAGVVAVVWGDKRALGAVLAMILLLLPYQTNSEVVDSERTFFGVYRVLGSGDVHSLMSGTTGHGFQKFVDGVGQMDPLSYYHSDGPVGDVMAESMAANGSLDVGVVGLGVGSTAGYGRAADRYTFYEIDGAVERIARDPELFTYLEQSPAQVSVVIGDGRLELETRAPSHDILMVDAFTSDSIPVHLLTVEAVESYLESLAPGGKLLIHVSNRHLNLAPVVGRIAEELGVDARIRRYSPADGVELSAPSGWIVIEKAGEEPLRLNVEWEPVGPGATLWTDDYSNILSVLRWR